VSLLLVSGLAWGAPPEEFFPETFAYPPAPPDPPLRRPGVEERIAAGKFLPTKGQLWSPQRGYRHGLSIELYK
jgi:transposase